MKIRGNRIEITQGETFTLDKLIVNEDGSPFIVSSKMLNPHILISISDSEYYTSGKYIKNYWLPIIKTRSETGAGNKTFSETRAVNLLSILNADTNGVPSYPDGFDSITALTPDGFVTKGYMPERGKYVGLYPSTCVFYVENSDGTKTYKYWDTELNKWVDYEFSIIKLFPSSDTKNWIPKKYFWNVSVCSAVGERIEDFTIDFNDTVIQLASDGEIFVKSRLKGV